MRIGSAERFRRLAAVLRAIVEAFREMLDPAG
jgi:hypothetical protein